MLSNQIESKLLRERDVNNFVIDITIDIAFVREVWRIVKKKLGHR